MVDFFRFRKFTHQEAFIRNPGTFQKPTVFFEVPRQKFPNDKWSALEGWLFIFFRLLVLSDDEHMSLQGIRQVSIVCF